MCILVCVHHMGCDTRPLMSTRWDPTRKEVPVVCAYLKPLRCGRECCVDPTAPLLPEDERCPSHSCCRLLLIELRCRCCEGMTDKGRLSGRYTKSPDECSHFVEYHRYIQDFSRAETRVAWRVATEMDIHLITALDADVPYETLNFIGTRIDTLKVACALYRARLRLIRAQMDFDNLDGKSFDAQEMIIRHYEETTGMAMDIAMAFKLCLRRLLESQARGEGTLKADFMEEDWLRGLGMLPRRRTTRQSHVMM